MTWDARRGVLQLAAPATWAWLSLSLLAALQLAPVARHTPRLARPRQRGRLASRRPRSSGRPRPRTAPDLAPSRGDPTLARLHGRAHVARALGGTGSTREASPAARDGRDRGGCCRRRRVRPRRAARLWRQALWDLERPDGVAVRTLRQQEPLRRLRRARGTGGSRPRHGAGRGGAPRLRMAELDREPPSEVGRARVGRCLGARPGRPRLALAGRRREPLGRARLLPARPALGAAFEAVAPRAARRLGPDGARRRGRRFAAALRGPGPRRVAGRGHLRGLRLLPAGGLARHHPSHRLEPARRLGLRRLRRCAAPLPDRVGRGRRRARRERRARSGRRRRAAGSRR